MDFNERHFGCRGREITYKGLRMLTLENELIKTTIVLDKGTDIIDFSHKKSDTDFLWHAPWEIRNPYHYYPTSSRPEGGFLDCYFGGWNEVLPTAIAGSVLGASFGDMGEAVLLPWNYDILEDQPELIRVRLSVELIRYPIQVEKIITIQSDSMVMKFDETISNLSDLDLDFMWGQHPTFGAPFLDNNCHLDLPECIMVTQQYGEFTRLCADEGQKWPFAKTLNGALVDLSEIQSQDARIEDMMYLTNLKEGWYGLTNQKKQVGFGMRWDLDIFPYLWYWQCYCGPNPQPFFGRAYAVGVEPWTTPPIPIEKAVKAG